MRCFRPWGAQGQVACALQCTSGHGTRCTASLHVVRSQSGDRQLHAPLMCASSDSLPHCSPSLASHCMAWYHIVLHCIASHCICAFPSGPMPCHAMPSRRVLRPLRQLYRLRNVMVNGDGFLFSDTHQFWPMGCRGLGRVRGRGCRWDGVPAGTITRTQTGTVCL